MATMVLDIGGTAIKSAICENAELRDVRETPTEASKGSGHMMRLATSLIRSYQADGHRFDRIGVSTAGQVDPISGTILFGNSNFPGYTGTCVKSILEQAFHVPTFVENDVNAAALGEARFGDGRNIPDFVMLTYGTGVGGALFLDGALYHGSSFSAGEFGAIVVHPEALDPERDLLAGCYERYASTTALVAMARQSDATLTDGRTIFRRRHEPAVWQVIDRWIWEVAYGLVTIIHMLNPACVLLGGGVMEQECILPRLSEILLRHLMPSFSHATLKPAALGNRAGLLGASVLHEQTHRRKPL